VTAACQFIDKMYSVDVKVLISRDRTLQTFQSMYNYVFVIAFDRYKTK